MRRYEIMVIISDTVEEDEALAVAEKIKNDISAQDGVLVDEAWWGKRQLAYEVRKRNHAFYLVLDVELSDDGLAEVERRMRLSDLVVRFKTVRPDTRVRQFA